MKISKAQQDTDDLTGFFVLLGSSHVKATRKHVGEMNPWAQSVFFNLRFKPDLVEMKT